MKNWLVIILSIVLVANTEAKGLPEQNDSVNIIDGNNLKQGHWIYLNRDKKLPGYKDDQVVEEGNYSDNLKTGTWKQYFNNNKVKHEITYQNNRPNGFAIFYYKSGKKREEGTWKNNRWIGDYKYYYENGNIANEWHYSNQGRRTGIQKYYYENGQLMIEGDWKNGKESGTVKEYFENGELKSEKFYADGKFDATKSKTYESKEPVKPVAKEPVKAEPTAETTKAPVVKKDAEKKDEAIGWAENKPKFKQGVFDGNGMYQLRDRKGRIVREGDFSNGFLKDGKVYQYTADGKLFKTTVYAGGKIQEIINHEE